MSNNLYEQAIADARKIREVAEENAKKAVLEAVTPKIREFGVWNLGISESQQMAHFWPKSLQTQIEAQTDLPNRFRTSLASLKNLGNFCDPEIPKYQNTEILKY